MNISVKALHDDTEFNLGLTALLDKCGMQRCVEQAQVQTTGLALAGLSGAVRLKQLQILGRAEMQYVATLSRAGQIAVFERMLQAQVPCIVLSSGGAAPEAFVEMARTHQMALFSTPISSETFVSRVQQFLQARLGVEANVHGVLMDTFGVGLLITGQSGIGKSECALDLVLRGHRLIADDVVVVHQSEGALLGTSSPLTKHHMEVRGLGIINVRDLFGAASVCEKKGIELVVEMVEWQREADYDRMGIDDMFETILSIAVPRVRLPIRPGRNVASIVEVAARNHLLKLQGRHSAREFAKQLEKNLVQKHRTPKTL